MSSSEPNAAGPDEVMQRRLASLRMDTTTPARPPRHGWRWVVVAVLGLGALGAGIAGWRLQTPRVDTARVQSVTMAQASTILTATGYTYARRKANVGAKIVGRIVELRVDEGDTVRAGDIIVRLDSRDLDAATQQAEARLAEKKANLADALREKNRQQRLFEKEVVAEEARDAASTRLELAEAQVLTAEAELAAARAQLDYATIRAPLDGVVIEKNVELGEMVAPGGFTTQQSTGALVRIADLTSLEVEADINESYIARLHVGQPAEVQVDAVPDRTYRGRLRQIVPTGDRQKAVVEVKVSIDDRDWRLVPDMGCKVTFVEAETRAGGNAPTVLVPNAAVVRDGDAAHVFVLQSGMARKTAVVLGDARDAAWVVRSGLHGGETVATSGLDKLADGKRVRVREGREEDT